MDLTLAKDQLLLRRDLTRLGIGRAELKQAQAHSKLTRVRRGVWAPSVPPNQRDAYQQQVRAALLTLGDDVVISHQSAAAFLGLPIHRAKGQVWFTRSGHGGGHRRGNVHVIRSPLDDSEWSWQQDLRITDSARTTIDVARTQPFETGVMVADQALRQGCTRAQLQAALDRAARWPGMSRARLVVDFADSRSESPYESWMRVLLDELNLGPLVLQRQIHDGDGQFVARVDAALEELKLAFEYDGEGKYCELLEPGLQPVDAFRAEKERDASLNRLGWWVCHFSKLDVHDRSRFRRVAYEGVENARRLQRGIQ